MKKFSRCIVALLILLASFGPTNLDAQTEDCETVVEEGLKVLDHQVVYFFGRKIMDRYFCEIPRGSCITVIITCNEQ